MKSDKKNLIKSDEKYRKALELLEDNPDIEDELRSIKLDIVDAVKNENRKQVANCVNRINILSKKLEYRSLLPNSFKLNNDEKEELKQREIEIKKRDPYGEEDWSDEKG